VVLHVCANTDLIIELICQTGAVGLSIEEKADLKRAAAIAHQQEVWVFGNLATATATTLFKGTPEEVYREAIAALGNATDYPLPRTRHRPPLAAEKQ